METTDVELRDRTVIGADGNAIGQVAAMIVDAGSWVVKALRIKLRDIAADQRGGRSGRVVANAEGGAHDQGQPASP